MIKPNIDPAEIAKFSELSTHWWDTEGELRTLHQINPLRLRYINDKAKLAGKNVLDIGCGGGILAEGMAKIGANVTGIDMSESSINVAKLHQYESGTNVDYLVTTAESLAAERPAQFDVVTCLEMLEHVPDPASIIQAAAKLVKPGGQVFFSTINRTVKSYLLAIVGAEYILKLIPKNTHDYAKFIRPSELSAWARAAGLRTQDVVGMTYNPFTKECKLSEDVSVNYLVQCVTQASAK
jgi:2-polyprenyl-6-hydroxyphenyl methylase/3-demethylubiquinone-9 3-methyltransferase